MARAQKKVEEAEHVQAIMQKAISEALDLQRNAFLSKIESEQKMRATEQKERQALSAAALAQRQREEEAAQEAQTLAE